MATPTSEPTTAPATTPALALLFVDPTSVGVGLSVSAALEGREAIVGVLVLLASDSAVEISSVSVADVSLSVVDSTLVVAPSSISCEYRDIARL